MKAKKALLALLLAAAMSLSLLVGCADTPPNNGTPAPTPDGAQGEAQPDTPDAAPSAPEESTEDIASNAEEGKTLVVYYSATGSTDSSGLGQSGELLAELAGTGDWQEGQRFRSSVAEADVVEWVNGLNLQ